MTIQSQKNIIEFQITINDSVLMEVLESQTDFCCIESAGGILSQSLFICWGGISNGEDILCSFQAELTALNMQHQITTTDVLHDEVYTGFCLETGMQVEEEWVAFLVGNQEDTLF